MSEKKEDHSKRPRAGTPPSSKKRDKKESTPTPPEPATPPTPPSPIVAPVILPVKPKKEKAPAGNIEIASIRAELDLSDCRFPCRVTGAKEHQHTPDAKPTMHMVTYELTQTTKSISLTVFSFTDRVVEVYHARQLRLPVPGDVVIVTGMQVQEAKYEAKDLHDQCLKGDVSRLRFQIIDQQEYIAKCPFAKTTQHQAGAPPVTLPVNPEDLFNF